MENSSESKSKASHVDPGLARHGHLSYIEIPALDLRKSADFYESVFGWSVRGRDTDHPGFDDGSGALIGHWIRSRAPSRESGIVPYIYVNRIDETVQRIAASGGEMVKLPYPEGDLWVATFRDPAGNLIGIWQAGPR